MCLTTEQFAQFLNLIGADLVTRAPGRIVVHAAEGDVVWRLVGAAWCLG